MLVEDSQCAAYVTEFGSQSVNTALRVVQGVISLLSIIGSVLLILTYVLLKPLRTKSRLLITHLAVANLLNALPNFMAVFMNFSTRFKAPAVASTITHDHTHATKQFNITEALSCSGSVQLFDSTKSIYCHLCVSLGFVSLVGVLSTIFWTFFVCVHFFILVSYRNTKLASRAAYVYYIIAWLAPLGICLWLLFHNWLGFQPTYSTVNCDIKSSCVPHHHPYHYQNSYGKNNWNRTIGVLFGIKIWQVLVFLVIPCLFVAIQCKKRKYRAEHRSFFSSPIKSVERKMLLIPIIYMLISTARFVSDIYFFINHDKNLENLRSSDGGITVVHFLTRVCDNSQGVINFCLFCLCTKEVRSATVNAIKKLCHCQSANMTTTMPEVSWFTPITSETRSTPPAGYGILNSEESDNPLKPSLILN